MSNAPHRRRRPHRPDRDTTTRLGITSARARGCTCTPTIQRRHEGGNVYRLVITHDHDCPVQDR